MPSIFLLVLLHNIAVEAEVRQGNNALSALSEFLVAASHRLAMFTSNAGACLDDDLVGLDAAAYCGLTSYEQALDYSSNSDSGDSSSDDSVCADNQDTAAAKLQEDAAEPAAEVLPSQALAQHTTAASEQELQGDQEDKDKHSGRALEHIAEPEEQHQQADHRPAATAETLGNPAATVPRWAAT